MKLTMAIGFILYLQAADAGRHQSAGRVRNINAANPWKALQNQGDSASLISALQKQAQELEEEEASILELVQALEAASGLSVAPTVSTTGSPTLASVPSVSPSLSVQPSNGPSPAGIVFDTENPTISAAPSALPTISPTISAAPSNNPTLAGCGTTPEEREAAIFGILDQVADSSLIRDITTPQGQAARWIISEDELRLCPNDLKIVQRWVLAVMYFSTGGDSWTQCFQDDVECGVFLPFLNQEAFLSPSTECEWAGIACDAMACVTEIEFEENNLVGTIPTELGLLDELVVWGMERGNLTGTIPTEIGQLEDLIFIDLDFNQLTGTIPTELFNLVNLTQLDLNNNFIEGNIGGIGAFTQLEFLQLHSNFFTGTIPEVVGSFTALSTFTLHQNNLTGGVPVGLCGLVDGGILTSLIADCGGDVPEITCECCTDCRE